MMIRLNPISLKLFYIAIVASLVSFALFKADCVDTLKFSRQFVAFEQWIDSWGPMGQALEYLVKDEPGKQLIYSHIFFDQKFKFQYPLTSLLAPYAIFQISDHYIGVLKAITWAGILMTIFFVTLIFHRGAGIRLGFYPDSLMVTASIGILTLLFYPIVKAYSLGQIQVWINALFSALFYCWMRNWQAPSGILLGLMCLIKPQYALIAVWGALRGKWRFAFCFGGVFAAGVLLSVLLFGLDNNLNYLPVLSYLSHHGEAFFPNQSMNGLLNRLLFNAPILDFNRRAFPPFNPVVYYGSMFFAVSLLSLAIVVPKLAKKEGSVLDLAVIAMVATMVSPIAWEHHYGILLPIYAFVFLSVLAKGDKKYLVALAVSYFLGSNFMSLEITSKLAYLPYWNFLLSYVFIAALMLLVILFLLLYEPTLSNLFRNFLNLLDRVISSVSISPIISKGVLNVGTNVPDSVGFWG